MARVCILSSVHLALDNRVFYREACSLRRAGYEVTLIAVHPYDEEREGIQIRAVPRVPRWQRPRLWIRILQIARVLRADVYHFHDPELLLATPWLRLLTRRPTIYDVHESYPEFVEVKDYLPAWLRTPVAAAVRWAEPLLSRLQSALVFADDQIAEAFAGISCPKVTLYNFPSRAFVEQALAATTRRRPREPVVLYLGGMERNRGSELAVEAFRLVLRHVPEARLLMVGHFEPADLEQEFADQAARLGIGGALTLAGRVPFEEVGGYLARAAVGWVPWQPAPKNEKNVPTKLFEYMAYALPVVASDLPSIRPFVRDGETGFCVRADDAQAHADAIVTLLRKPEEAEAMGRQGQTLVDRSYNWDEMERRLLDLYAKLLAREG